MANAAKRTTSTPDAETPQGTISAATADLARALFVQQWKHGLQRVPAYVAAQCIEAAEQFESTLAEASEGK